MRNTVSKRITTGIIILAESALISMVSGINFLTITAIVLPFVVGTKFVSNTVIERYREVI